MIHADAELARRLEAIICDDWRRLAEIARELRPERKPTYVEVAGGVALWLGEGSPINVAVGLGMEGPVAEADLHQVEDFYARRGASPLLQTCPFAHPTLFVLLARHGWQITEFENVLALELETDVPPAPSPLTLPPGTEVRACAPGERPLWGSLATQGLTAESSEPTAGRDEFGSVMVAQSDLLLVLAWVDGKPVGTGALGIDGTVGWLMGDSTLPQYRGRGIQQAIQRYRLELARDAGCTLAVTEAAPGSGSQRNMERLGFRVVYTHLEFSRV